MFVVPNQLPRRVRAESRLPCATKPKEQGHISLRAHITGRVQWQGPVCGAQMPLRSQGHVIHHHREDSLLHLPGILCAQDHHLTPTKRQGHGSGRRHASRVPVAWEAACIEDHKRPGEAVGLELVELRLRRWDEHVLHEERMIRPRGYDTDRDSVLLVPACKAVHNVKPFLSVQVVHGSLTVDLEHGLLQLDVDLPPPNVTHAVELLHNALVLGGSPCLLAAGDRQGTRRRDEAAFLVTQCLLVEHSRTGVVVYVLDLKTKVRCLVQDVKLGAAELLAELEGILKLVTCRGVLPDIQVLSQGRSDALLEVLGACHVLKLEGARASEGKREKG
mmetsp:Transcript_73682/g.175678  ORF Transcript_73682/g.175678 Transcript_73682/m.175678 type:complete len:332 (-) Transcript_73682:38-1033(-)